MFIVFSDPDSPLLPISFNTGASAVVTVTATFSSIGAISPGRNPSTLDHAAGGLSTSAYNRPHKFQRAACPWNGAISLS
jgi:hypothetical protein